MRAFIHDSSLPFKGIEVAWDIYLFYEAGVEWVKTPPQPAYWMHQLTDSWADREHYHTGDNLVDEHFMAMKRLL